MRARLVAEFWSTAMYMWTSTNSQVSASQEKLTSTLHFIYSLAKSSAVASYSTVKDLFTSLIAWCFSLVVAFFDPFFLVQLLVLIDLLVYLVLWAIRQECGDDQSDGFSPLFFAINRAMLDIFLRGFDIILVCLGAIIALEKPSKDKELTADRIVKWLSWLLWVFSFVVAITLILP